MASGPAAKRSRSIDPATARSIAHCAAGDKADIDAAVHAARQALESGPWSRMTASRTRPPDLETGRPARTARRRVRRAGNARQRQAVGRGPGGRRAAGRRSCSATWPAGRPRSTARRFPFPCPIARQRVLQLHAPRADRRGGADHSLELSAVDGRLETRPGPGGGLHGRAQAGRANAAQRPAAGRVD